MVDLTSYIQRLLFTLRQIGWQSRIGLALWGIAILLAFWLKAEYEKQHALEAMLAQPLKNNEAIRQPKQPGDTMARFYALLPKESEVDVLSERILREADDIGLQFERAEFNEIKNTQTTLLQHQIKLPIRGNYLQIRQFLNGLLNTQPALALTEFKVHRDDVFTDLVEANLVLTLYLRGDAK